MKWRRRLGDGEREEGSLHLHWLLSPSGWLIFSRRKGRKEERKEEGRERGRQEGGRKKGRGGEGGTGEGRVAPILHHLIDAKRDVLERLRL